MGPAESEDFFLKRSVGRRSAAYTVPVIIVKVINKC